MPPSLSPDVLPTIDTLVDRNASREQIVALGAQQIRRLREDLRAGANITPEQQRKLERLQAIIGTRISLIEAAAGVSDDVRKEIVTELQTLREVMDKRFILPDYAPDSPDAVRKALQFTAGSLDVGIRTLNAATRDLPTVARVGIFAGAGVATALALKWIWDELGIIGKAAATGVAGSLGFLGFQKLQENWSAIVGFFRGMKGAVTGWFGGEPGNKEQQQGKKKEAAEQEKKKEEVVQQQGKNKEEKDRAAKDAADKRAAEAKEKLRNQTLLKESTKQFVDALNARAEGALLTNPPWRLNTAGMELEMGPDRIFVRRSGTLFRVGVTMIVSGNPHTFDLNQLHRFNVNPQTPRIRFNALSDPFTKAAPVTAKTLRSGLSPQDVAPALAEAMVLFQGGGNIFEKNIRIPPIIGILIGRLRINLEEVR